MEQELFRIEQRLRIKFGYFIGAKILKKCDAHAKLETSHINDVKVHSTSPEFKLLLQGVKSDIQGLKKLMPKWNSRLTKCLYRDAYYCRLCSERTVTLILQKDKKSRNKRVCKSDSNVFS